MKRIIRFIYEFDGFASKMPSIPQKATLMHHHGEGSDVKNIRTLSLKNILKI